MSDVAAAQHLHTLNHKPYGVQVRGLSLHDLRFRGQRVVYELATQELYVSYNGYGGASA
jgi:Copper amine oxidase, enzyme domain